MGGRRKSTEAWWEGGRGRDCCLRPSCPYPVVGGGEGSHQSAPPGLAHPPDCPIVLCNAGIGESLRNLPGVLTPVVTSNGFILTVEERSLGVPKEEIWVKRIMSVFLCVLESWTSGSPQSFPLSGFTIR